MAEGILQLDVQGSFENHLFHVCASWIRLCHNLYVGIGKEVLRMVIEEHQCNVQWLFHFNGSSDKMHGLENVLPFNVPEPVIQLAVH